MVAVEIEDTEAPTRFDMMRVVRRTLGLLRRNLAVFLWFGFVFAALPQAAMYWGMSTFGISAALGVSGAPAVIAFALGAVGSVLGWAVLQAALIYAAIGDLNGRRTSLDVLLYAGLRFVFPLVGLGVLMTLALAAGAVLLIAPALFLATIWIAAAPMLVIERLDAVECLRRSARLTKGRRWPVFGLVIAGLLISWVLREAASRLGLAAAYAGLDTSMNMLGSSIPQNPGLLTLAAAGSRSLVGAVMSLITGLGVASIYWELKATRTTPVDDTFD
ncbi:hypothetical protein [Caulobacter sp. 17J65-9]|uniref:hypothetical protein n=1 Tax=Caulobacter sp. 17J65-9 TaxID=2709382 RepID=UPI0013C6CA5B|nr:hypothetical protein [Caulobacter sp. 17J65-9]NEX91595.1 hypothetical protein [Caulobacter sp. 17J65-9]